ncbi:MAG: methyltransferase domain-containing protein [Saprospiraceae bacterium]|nr:methyltransferase domain-containing protein [Saprospiraceae bacterium]
MPLHYRFWSPSLNVHFGYFRWGDNPFQREGMLRQMNAFVAWQLALETSSPAHILDVGCGYGATVAQLQRHFPKATFTGINNSTAQLEVAMQSCPTSEFRVADFEAMPFLADRFDAAYALESACFAEGETKEKLLVEMARVLRPGGRLVIVDGFKRQDGPLPKLVDWLYQKSLAAWGMPSLAPIDGFEKALQKQGFEKIAIKDISWNIAPSLAHIPVVAMKLFVAHLVKNDKEQLRYLQALLLTLALSPFKRHFGYYTVTCVKTIVELEK